MPFKERKDTFIINATNRIVLKISLQNCFVTLLCKGINRVMMRKTKPFLLKCQSYFHVEYSDYQTRL